MRCRTQQYRNGHSHTLNFVMVIITLKTILKEKVGYHFCQVILLFWLQQKVLPCKKFQKMMNIFYQKFSRLLEKRQTIPTGSRPQLKTTALNKFVSNRSWRACELRIVLQRHHCIELQCLWNLILVFVWFVNANVVKCTWSGGKSKFYFRFYIIHTAIPTFVSILPTFPENK